MGLGSFWPRGIYIPNNENLYTSKLKLHTDRQTDCKPKTIYPNYLIWGTKITNKFQKYGKKNCEIFSVF